jgi:hypothetical protein
MSTIVATQTSLDRPVLPADNHFAGQVRRQQNADAWKGWQKVLLRIAFVFFVFMSLPTAWSWYQHLFTMDWTNLHYRDIYDLARFSSGFSFVGNAIWGNNLLGYANWIITLGVAVALGLVWTAIDRKRRSYNDLYYWLRVIVRYRAGIGIIGFGFTKLLPVQMPYPSEGLLNTDLGDLTAQKIYWLSIGIVPWYQVFAGIVELAAGTFLFFRKTTLLGAILLFGALGDIVYVNFAYDGGVHVYSSYFVLLAAFLMIQDLPVLYDYFIRQRLTTPRSYYPSFQQSWLKATRVGLKAVTIFIFLGLLFYLQYVNFRYDPYKQPSTKGVKQLRGFYDVTEFRLNNKVIPYSPFDTVRWQEATFEKWSTLTFKVNKPVQLDLSNGGGSPMRDINRTFELTGVAGGRRVFYYDADTVNNLLFLQDKNTASNRRRVVEGNSTNGDTEAKTKTPTKDPRRSWIPAASLAVISSEDLKIDKRARSTRRTKGIKKELKETAKRARMVLRYSTNDGSRVFLTGINENKDSIYIVLDRADKKYTLSRSTLIAGEY